MYNIGHTLINASNAGCVCEKKSLIAFHFKSIHAGFAWKAFRVFLSYLRFAKLIIAGKVRKTHGHCAFTVSTSTMFSFRSSD